jgi:hypothetical protein
LKAKVYAITLKIQIQQYIGEIKNFLEMNGDSSLVLPKRKTKPTSHSVDPVQNFTSEAMCAYLRKQRSIEFQLVQFM